MPAHVLARARRRGVRAADVRRDARALLDAMNESASELTVALVDDDAIRELNRRYRRADRSTDVLAFAMREGPRTQGTEQLLGDLVISLDTAARQASARRRSPAMEVRTLLIHGLLHLLGYDHERSAAAAREMHALERRLARRLRRECAAGVPRRPKREGRRGGSVRSAFRPPSR